MTLLFLWRITQKICKFHKYENFSIPEAVSCEFALLKGTVARDCRPLVF
jgi:hypothetical protein